MNDAADLFYATEQNEADGQEGQSCPSRLSQRSEVDSDVQAHEARRLNRRRLQVVRSRAVVLIERQASVRVEEIEEIDASRRLVAAERQHLRGPQIHEVDARPVERTGLNEVVRRARRRA